MATYSPAAQPVLSRSQFHAMAPVAEGQQYGGVRAALNSSSATPAAAAAPSGGSVTGTLATFSQAAKTSVL